MKRLLVTSAVLACIASPAFAAGFTTWQGDLFITAVNDAAACKAVNMAVGQFARGVFRPKNVGSNGTQDLLAWVFPISAGQIVPNTGTLNGSTAATIRIIYGSAGFQQFTNAVLSGVVVNPATMMGSEATVAIQVTIQDAYSKNTSTPSGCDVTLKGTLAKRLS